MLVGLSQKKDLKRSKRKGFSILKQILSVVILIANLKQEIISQRHDIVTLI